MNAKMKLFTPLILALALALSWLTLLNANSLPSHRAWAANEELEGEANGTLASDEVSISSVSPDYGWNDEEVAVYINGSGFTMPLTVTLLSREITVSEVLSERITAIIPAGLLPGRYDVTVEIGSGQVATFANGYQVLLASEDDDLVSLPEWLLTDPFQLREDTPNGMIGLNVERIGGRETWTSVQVCFELDIPPEPEPLGCREVPFLPANSVQWTGGVLFTPAEAGEYRICAQIDPENHFNETDESNNTVCRIVTVLDDIPPWREDDEPPKVDEFVIADGAQSTSEITVTLSVTATDQETPDQPVSGVSHIEFIEFGYSFDAQRWVPIQRSDWLHYLTAHENYPWTLTTTYGLRYIEAWALDKAGNISNPDVGAWPGIDMINLVPEEQVGFVAKNEIVFYRIFLQQGETFEAILTPISGDPDLYVWGARDEPWVSTHPTEVDSVAFEAPETGTYQIEVHGYDGDAEYRLTFGVRESPTRAFSGFRSASKPVLSAPRVPLDDLPESFAPPSANEPDLSNNSTVEESTVEGVSISSVSPNYGRNDEERAVFIKGSGFTMPLTVTLLGREITVSEVLSERITAIIPAGLPPGWYDVTVEIGNGQVSTLTNGYQVLLPSSHDDFLSFPEWLWIEQLRENTRGGMIGLNVQRLGGQESWRNVQVCFELDIPGGLAPLGCREVPFLAPNSVNATFSVPFTPAEAGEYRICAQIDPENHFNETDESNNTVCRIVTVLDDTPPFSEDNVPPRVNEFVIADGAQSTTEITVTLSVTATDQETPDQPVSGIDQIEFIEFVYLFDAERWIPIQRSGWVPYLTAHENYPWTLTTTYGVRYMQAWAMDKAGNISNADVNAPPGIDMINLVPEEQVASVAKNEVVFYRIFLEQGDTFEAILTPISGDPDLYVWGARDEPWYSNSPTEVDSVAFEAPDTGTYQIEVHGYDGDAEYRLTFGITQESTGKPSSFQGGSKPIPDSPVVALDNTPQSIGFNDISPPYTIYLPMTIR